jgi:HSP20 family protein
MTSMKWRHAMSQKEHPVPGRSASANLFQAPRGFQAIRDEIDRMFHALSLPEMDWRSGPGGTSGTLGLRVDVGETDGEILVTAELPGVDEKDVEVVLEDDMLRVRAEKRSEAEDKDKTWHVVERSYGSFERAIRVPAGIDPDSVKASFANGVLTVSLPKPAEAVAARKKIPISAG